MFGLKGMGFSMFLDRVLLVWLVSEWFFWVGSRLGFMGGYFL